MDKSTLTKVLIIALLAGVLVFAKDKKKKKPSQPTVYALDDMRFGDQGCLLMTGMKFYIHTYTMNTQLAGIIQNNCAQTLSVTANVIFVLSTNIGDAQLAIETLRETVGPNLTASFHVGPYKDGLYPNRLLLNEIHVYTP